MQIPRVTIPWWPASNTASETLLFLTIHAVTFEGAPVWDPCAPQPESCGSYQLQESKEKLLAETFSCIPVLLSGLSFQNSCLSFVHQISLHSDRKSRKTPQNVRLTREVREDSE